MSGHTSVFSYTERWGAAHVPSHRGDLEWDMLCRLKLINSWSLNCTNNEATDQRTEAKQWLRLKQHMCSTEELGQGFARKSHLHVAPGSHGDHKLVQHQQDQMEGGEDTEWIPLCLSTKRSTVETVQCPTDKQICLHPCSLHLTTRSPSVNIISGLVRGIPVDPWPQVICRCPSKVVCLPTYARAYFILTAQCHKSYLCSSNNTGGLFF